MTDKVLLNGKWYWIAPDSGQKWEEVMSLQELQERVKYYRFYGDMTKAATGRKERVTERKEGDYDGQ